MFDSWVTDYQIQAIYADMYEFDSWVTDLSNTGDQCRYVWMAMGCSEVTNL